MWDARFQNEEGADARRSAIQSVERGMENAKTSLAAGRMVALTLVWKEVALEDDNLSKSVGVWIKRDV